MTTPAGHHWGDTDLPVELTSFVGRQREVKAVKEALADARVVTLAGVGGIGKTRLALKVATELRRAFTDGVAFFDLSAAMDRSTLDSVVLDALRIRGESDHEAAEIITNFLCERQMLLVFDNCEHIVAESAALINTVIRRAPQVRVLATSRERLWVTGEYVWRVPPLSVPDPDPEAEFVQGVPGSSEYPALALFAERAAAVGGGPVAREDWPEVARLCRRLDGLPLAIELAAVQARMLSPSQLIRRFDERLGTLATRDRSAPARHRSLEAAIEWSYELCSPDERLLWARASVFAGPFSLESAESVCSGEDLPREKVMDLVTGLIDKSLLVHEEHLAEVQFRQLETLAQYGRVRLSEAGTEAELARRHRDRYLQLAEQSFAHSYSSDQLLWSRRLRRERGNLNVAFEYCLSTPGEEQVALRFTAALLQYWYEGGGQLAEGRRWLEAALAVDAEPTWARVMSLRNLAWICSQQQDPANAEAALRDCRDLARHLHDPLMDARIISTEAELAMARRDFATSIARSKEALACPEYAADPARLTSFTILTLGHAMLGNYEEAVRAHQETQRCRVESGETSRMSWALVGRAVAELGAGKHSSVVTYTRECIRLAREFDSVFALSAAFAVMLSSTTAEDDFVRGATLLGARQRVRHALGITGVAAPAESDIVDAATTRIRAELGEALFEATVARGFAHDLNGALDYALGIKDEPAPATETGSAQAQEPADALTPRERQVAALVAQGMSNKQIAAQLVLSPRTVEGHVEHILTKLGFTSRAHIAAWNVRQGR
ncbi:LuxR C-terminal-related transcriptional regulator [Streptomyces sp. NBC_00347]|uniref:LuxR C-terminal-related transcriptional regulator n=1 Tax=Streptomyces sp. NBC_00347 TaxID=2975721 RepID=UPI002252FF9A|nr:LuxR C-terminal-related transcriptional regulator [Streptomyces sp. NBC_00347]MCX5126700.1 LuxR C-terminal-related transcriptional regulator [Streptomyces sp. NBC_00347]